MQNELNIALVETNLIWENPEENRKMLQSKIDRLKQDVDLIILPEMFSSGFTMNPEKVAESMTGKSMTWLKSIAQLRDTAIIGSLVISENDQFYNRLIFVKPDGSIFQYDKKHTFTLAGEHKAYTAGTRKTIIDYKGWKICPLVCYDLRFPVWARNVEDYDLLIYVANWPEPRINAWDALLKARAIENMSYCIGVNRTGKDGNGHKYPGHSAIYDVLGNTVELNKDLNSHIFTGELNHRLIHKYRQKLNFLSDRDHFQIIE